MTNIVRFPTMKNTAVELLTDVLADAVEHEKRGNKFGVIVLTVWETPERRKYKEAFTLLPGEQILTAAALLEDRAKELIDEVS